MIYDCKFSMLFLILVIMFSSCLNSRQYPEGDGRLDPFKQAELLGKGINLGNMLDAFPNEGNWSDGFVLEESDFDTAKLAGFDTIRLPVCFAAHAKSGSPYTLDPLFMKRVDQVIGWGLEKGFRIVLDNHHAWDLMKNPSQKQQKRLIKIWKQIASRYRDYPAELYYEILNEPTEELSPELWNDLQKQCMSAIRQKDAYHTIIVTGAEWSAVSGLLQLDIPEEETNAIASFHYYNPQLFCFQGAPWNSDEYATTGIIWPGPPETPVETSPKVPKDAEWVFDWLNDYNNINDPQQNPAGPGLVEREIAKAVEWGKLHNRPLWAGEFGTYDEIETVSRNNWIRFVRREFGKHGISWAFWATSSAKRRFLTDRKNKTWLSEITDGLELTPERLTAIPR